MFYKTIIMHLSLMKKTFLFSLILLTFICSSCTEDNRTGIQANPYCTACDGKGYWTKHEMMGLITIYGDCDLCRLAQIEERYRTMEEDMDREHYNEGIYEEHYETMRTAEEQAAPSPKAIDLGLSVLWADRNLGASSPDDYGDYFAWGETSSKTIYGMRFYKYRDDDFYYTKYCNDSFYGRVDNRTQLQTNDDAAHIIWGGSWRMPTRRELEDLIACCEWAVIKQDGIPCCRITGKNGQSIILPIAGFKDDEGLQLKNEWGYYWSSTLNSSDCQPWYLSCGGGGDVGDLGTYERDKGLTIRPVMDKP